MKLNTLVKDRIPEDAQDLINQIRKYRAYKQMFTKRKSYLQGLLDMRIYELQRRLRRRGVEVDEVWTL